MSGLEQWLSFIEKLEKEWEDKDIGKSWIKTCPAEITNMEMIDNAFDVCKYENMTLKLAQLEKQYINTTSKKEALMKWEDGANIVTISLVGGAKWGTAANNKHCLRAVTIRRDCQLIVLDVRSSDFIKKFPTDLYFLRNVVLKEFGVDHYKLNINFDSIMLRSPFYYIYLEQIYKHYGKLALITRLNNPSNMMKSFLRYYHKNMENEISYKSLNRARERFMECECFDLVLPYIQSYDRK